MRDLYGREINYLRISVTDLCNLRCRYCMPEKGIDKTAHQNVLNYEEMFRLVQAFIKSGINKIRITGGEPLVRRDCLKLIECIGKEPGVKDFSITTNGRVLKKYARQLKDAGLNRVNVSLDTLDAEKYASITRVGKLSDVLEGIEEAERVGLSPLKINTVLIGGFNVSEIKDLVNLTVEKPISLRFIELMPMGEASSWAEENFVSNDVVLDKVKQLIPIPRADKSSPARYYKLPGAAGTVGLISPVSCSFCGDCNRIRLTSTGQLKPCLHSDDEIDLRGPLRSGENVEELIKRAILQKPEAHHLVEGQYIRGNMSQIGG